MPGQVVSSTLDSIQAAVVGWAEPYQRASMIVVVCSVVSVVPLWSLRKPLSIQENPSQAVPLSSSSSSSLLSSSQLSLLLFFSSVGRNFFFSSYLGTCSAVSQLLSFFSSPYIPLPLCRVPTSPSLFLPSSYSSFFLLCGLDPMFLREIIRS